MKNGKVLNEGTARSDEEPWLDANENTIIRGTDPFPTPSRNRETLATDGTVIDWPRLNPGIVV
jgi:hypothetical protein